MPAKRSRQSEAFPSAPAANGANGSSDVGDLKSTIEASIAEWDSQGQSSIIDLLRKQVIEISTSPTGDLQLSHTIICLLESSLSVEAMVQCFSSLVDGCEEDHIATFGESLVDIVEILEDQRENLQEMKKMKTMDVDGQPGNAEVVLSGGQKGLEVIKSLMDSNVLPSYIPNLLFSPDRLLSLGLHPMPHNPQGLQRAHIKRNTTLFFKQSKYNLLRESSEGFSGLIVLLTGGDVLIIHPSEEDSADRKIRAKRVWAKIMGLIGYFNLSPPRVLDLILEISSCHVAAHWRFWVDLLECSPWGGTGDHNPPTSGNGKGKGKAISQDWEEEELQGIREVLDKEGDRVLAQVLGVKFGFYQRQDSGGETPMGLIYMAALLIKHRFVSLSDLLPFLSPDDTEMNNIHKKYLSSISSRSGPVNALYNAVLVDDDAPATTAAGAEEPTGPPPKPPPEQRIQLLQALLAIGDIPSSEYFLAKYPWTVQSHPAIADLILRNLKYAISPIYKSLADQEMSNLEPGELGLDDIAPTYKPSRKVVVPTLLSPVPPETSTKIFEFFYPNWSRECEVWEKPDDIRIKGLRWLSLLRGLGSRMVELMIKICGIGAAHFAALRREKEVAKHMLMGAKTREELQSVEPTSQEIDEWLDIIRIALLPALSASNATAAFDIELWALIKHFPYSVRYCLYGEWRDSTCNFNGRNACPVAAHAAAESTREVKKALSRVTAATSASIPGGPAAADRGPARALAKLSHSNPCALWESAVKQVRSYSNIGQYIVEAGRYMTQLSMDVAAFTLVDTLSDDRASRINEQGTGIAPWLENLSVFTGDFNRRFAQMDLEPVLQFIINRLMRGESLDLSILQSLLSIMSGSTTIENDAISDDQLKAYATGREMVREAFNITMISITRPIEGDPTAKSKEAPIDKTKSVKKSLPRLINALRETHLAMPIWIALAQTRQSAVDTMASTPIKAMSSMQDNCHDIFIQYGDLLSLQLSPEEHINSTPDLASLVKDYGLDFAMAFQILRPRLNAELDRVRAEQAAQRQAAVAAKLHAEKEAISIKGASPTREEDVPITPKSAIIALDGDEAMDGLDDNVEEAKAVDALAIPDAKSGLTRTPKVWWPSALTSTMQQARALLPQEVNDVMSAPFFVIFWHLTIPDISYSAESYLAAIDRITAMEKDVASWRTANQTDQKAERRRLRERADILSKEKESQAALVKANTQKRLKMESSKWFGKSIMEKQLQRRLSQQLHQYCFFPRAILTPSDAIFVAKFIRMAHEMGTTSLSTLFAYNNFFNDQLAASIFSCTVNEARNFGRCLGAIMADLDVWHNDEARYKREALGQVDKPVDGEEVKSLPGMLFKSKPGTEALPMAWPQFRNFFAKCHHTLAKALVSCWGEKDFMHIKNAITVALQVIKYFPVMQSDGTMIENAVKKLIDTGDLTPDVQHQCNAYLRNLSTRQRTRPYMTAADFHSTAAFRLAAAAKAQAANNDKSVPSGPRTAPDAVETKPSTRSAVRELAKAASSTDVANGSNTPKATATATVDTKALRQKLEEQRLAKSAVKTEVNGTKASPAPESPSGKDAGPPPAGPRATRSTTTVPQVSTSGKANGTATTSIPTGPAKPPSGPSGLPARPGSTHSASMGPPATTLTVDEERAAARARKFGTLAKPIPQPVPTGPSNTATAPSNAAAVESHQKAESPNPGSRRASPNRRRRSRSIESRNSDRAGISRRGRDDRDPRDTRESHKENGRGKTPLSRKPSVTGEDDDAAARKKQEELLQARQDKLDLPDERPRRSSRDNHKRETEKDRDDGKPKEKEKEKERDRGDRERSTRGGDDGASHKRKRDDDPPRRVDSLDRRDDKRDRDRRDTRRDGHHDDRPDDRRHHRDRHDDRRDPRRDDPNDTRRDTRRDDRDRERDRDRDRDARDKDRDRERDRPRMDRAREEPNEAREARDIRERRTPERRGVRDSRAPAPPTRPDGDHTPKRDAPRELLPSKPAASSDRIVEAPRQTRAAEAREQQAPLSPSNKPASAGQRYALPPRPDQQQRLEKTSNTLASRMGLPPQPSPPTVPSPLPRVASDASRQRPVSPPPTESADAGSGERKRPLEDGTRSREESPAGSKRIRIDRDKAKRGREGPSNRMLASAMRSANEK